MAAIIYSDDDLDTEEEVKAKRMRLNCPICFEMYREPKSLSCLHTFCKLCIHSHVMKMKEIGTLKEGIECPLCRKVTVVEKSDTLPEEWTRQLPANYALVGVIESVFGHKNEEKTLTKCQPCLKRSNSVNASMFCANCPDYLCSECAKIHGLFVVSQGHKLVKVENMASAFNQSALTHKMATLDRCETHSKQMEFYCANDKKLCCSSCVIISHRSCQDLVEVDKVTTVDEHQTAEIVKSKLMDIKEKLKTTAGRFVENEKEMDAHILVVKDKIQDIRGKLNRVVDEFEEKILNETAAIQNHKSAELNKGRILCESLIAALEESLCTHEAVVKHGTASQKFIAMHKLEEQYNSYEIATEEPLSKLQSVEISLELGEDIEKILDSTVEIGTLNVKSSKLVLNFKPVQLALVASLDLITADAETEEPLISGMTYISDGRLVAVDNKNQKCLIMNEDLKNVGSCKLGYKPLGIVHLHDDIVAITAGKIGKEINKYQVNKNGTLVHVETIHMTSNGFSISVIDNTSFAIGIYGGHKPACIVSNAGEEEFTIDFPCKAYGIDDARCAYMENGNKLILTMRDEHAVYIFDTKNNTKVVIKDDRIKQPWGIAVGKFGCFFICSRETHSIVQISSAGQIVNSCVVKSMEWPATICISEKRRKLAVSNIAFKNMKIQVYDLSSM